LNFSLYIAKRYLFTKSKNKAINYITLVAGLGIILGTAALFIVLSGFDGLKAFSLEFTSFTDPDFKVLPSQSKNISLSSTQRKMLSEIEGIASFSTVVEEKVLLSCEGKYLAIDLKGVDKYYPKKTIDSILTYGDWISQDLQLFVALPSVTSSSPLINEVVTGLKTHSDQWDDDRDKGSKVLVLLTLKPQAQCVL